MAAGTMLGAAPSENPPLSLAVFQADVTPPLGVPLCHGNVMPAKEIVDPLSARGIILFAAGGPIVLCAVDWTGIGNEANDVWREELAEAVGTTVDRVAVHVCHQHDAPAADYSTEEILADHDMSGAMFDVAFAEEGLKRVVRAAREAVRKPRRVTHLGYGKGKVENVASTRRVLTPDGKLDFWRSSRGGDKRGSSAPEGLIDPYLRTISFWDNDKPLVAVNYYACHGQSYYGRGGVSGDIIGIARSIRESQLPRVAQIYFDGAGGNIACGKYNDGSPKNRPVLADRLAQGMQRAWQSQKKVPISAADVRWRIHPVSLPVRQRITEQRCLDTLNDSKLSKRQRTFAARELAFLRRMQSGHEIPLTCLEIGPARVLQMPGELFVEYQLAAQRICPDNFVCMAAYGEYGTGYIGTRIAYEQGGYETGHVSRVAPDVEDVLMSAMCKLLGRKDEPPIKPSNILSYSEGGTT
jgi:hypothetical protein